MSAVGPLPSIDLRSSLCHTQWFRSGHDELDKLIGDIGEHLHTRRRYSLPTPTANAATLITPTAQPELPPLHVARRTVSASTSLSSRGRSRNARLNHFLRLPDELLLLIFTFLPSHTLTQVAYVCRRFERVALDWTLWPSVTMSRCHDNASWAFRGLARRQPRSVTLCQSTHDVPHASFVMFSTICTSRLRVLRVAGCRKFDDEIMSLLARNCDLESIDVSWTAITDPGVTAMAHGCSSSLRDVCLRGCLEVTSTSIATLAECLGRRLRLLDVQACHRLTNASLEALVACGAELHSLNVSHCPFFTHSAFKRLCVSQANTLTTLNLSGCTWVTDELVSDLARSLTLLTSLSLSACHLVSDTSLYSLCVHQGTPLRLLDVSHCIHVGDRALFSVADHCSRLEYLNVSDSSISGEGIRYFTCVSQALTHTLHTLKVDRCVGFTTNTALRVTERAGAQLRVLSFFGCRAQLPFVSRCPLLSLCQ